MLVNICPRNEFGAPAIIILFSRHLPSSCPVHMEKIRQEFVWTVQELETKEFSSSFTLQETDSGPEEETVNHKQTSFFFFGLSFTNCGSVKRITRKPQHYQLVIEKERCSGSFHLAVGFLVIKDDSISERLG